VLCITLGIPLLAADEKTYQAARRFYPELDCKQIDPRELTLDFLAAHFDVIFESGHTWALELLPMLELLHNKQMRIVYCPHGNSDKGHSQKPIPKDLSLVYGAHMLDHLKKTGGLDCLNSVIETGNYRFGYYKSHQNFYDALLQPYLTNLDPRKKTIFYAPSWPDGENRSSFLSCGARVIEEVGEFYNVLIRWHPFLDEKHPVETQQLRKYANRKGIVFLDDFPCIYPILQAADAYLGEFSSIGYDFLAFDKPLYFLDSHFGKLYGCGTKLPLDSHLGKAIAAAPETAELQQERKKIHYYVFGRERNKLEIIEDLNKALSKERALWKGT
jgi:hypothetical protein